MSPHYHRIRGDLDEHHFTARAREGVIDSMIKCVRHRTTLTVRPGFPLRIIVNKDLILRRYVQTQGSGPAS